MYILLYGLIIIIGLISLSYIIIFINKTKNHPKEPFKFELEPLNRFTLDEPDYFFYDPYVPTNFSNQKIKKHDKSPHTQIKDIFGKDNYLRYYLK
jgi:hypothetical protein